LPQCANLARCTHRCSVLVQHNVPNWSDSFSSNWF
jgi:hypothetical protein